MTKAGSKPSNGIEPPLWFLAELTFRCPLACPYCSNPLKYEEYRDELDTGEWRRVLGEARALGSTQLCFSGGEPLLRKDLEELVAHARGLGFFSQVSTSAAGLSEARVHALHDAGLDHMQISFQGGTEDVNNYIGGAKTFHLKKKAAKLVKQLDMSLLINVVVHRYNIAQLDKILDLCEEVGADKVELANCQYHAWARKNRDQLMPTQAQLEKAEAVANAYRERLGARMDIFFVVPDYYAGRPKPCMGGWGKVFINLTPDGYVLPCHDARQLPGIDWPNVRDAGLEWIWTQSPAFNKFRGEDWMKAPCRTCPERHRDHGGCRCQAYMLTGDAANADPACSLSPHHHQVLAAQRKAEQARQVNRPLTFRDQRQPKMPASLKI